MKSGTLRHIGVSDFKAIPQDGIEAWFWADSDTAAVLPGVHLEKQLPDKIPPFATHIWGWGDARYVRIRVDQHLPDGFAAVEFTESDGEQGDCVYQVHSNLALGWGIQNLASSAKVLVVRRKDAPDTSVEFMRLY